MAEASGNVNDGGKKSLKRRTKDDDHGFAKKMKKSGLQLSSFTEMEESIDLNCGIFAVHDATFYPKGTKETLNTDLFNAVFIDNNGTHALFSAFGEDAQKWKTLKAGNVIQIEDFGWKKDVNEKSKYYHTAVTSDYVGKLYKGSSFNVEKDLSEGFQKILLEQKNHVFSLEEIIQSPDSFVVTFKQVLNENEFHKGGQIGHVRSLLFETADEHSLTISFFNEHVDSLNAMIETNAFEINKNYCIEGAKYHKQTRMYHDADFYYQASTRMNEVFVKAPEQIAAVSVTLADVYATDENEKSKMKMKGFLRSNPTSHLGNIQEAVVYDGSHDGKRALLGIMRYDKNTEFLKGDEVEFDFHIMKQENRKILNVIPGSLKKIDPADMEKPNISLISMLYI